MSKKSGLRVPSQPQRTFGIKDSGVERTLSTAHINTALPKQERMLDFIRQIGNPYCYRHGKYVVKVSFADSDVTLEQLMLTYLRSKL